MALWRFVAALWLWVCTQSTIHKTLTFKEHLLYLESGPLSMGNPVVASILGATS